MTFTENDCVKDILKHPILKDLSKWINPVSSSFLDVDKEVILNSTFKELSKKVGTWDSQLLIRSINTLVQNSLKGYKVDHNFYSDEEIQLDPDKRETGLLYFPGKEDAPFVLIIPGGGYYRVSAMHEGTGIAQALNDLGYNAFVLLYRVVENGYPKPMNDLGRAIKYIMNNYRDFKINPNGFSIMGFSAGGHLAASFGTKTLGYLKYDLPKPKTIILAYPVITMGEKTHQGSKYMLLGKNPSDEFVKSTSIEELVDKDYPETYLWHCKDDGCVNLENSKMLYNKLIKNHVNSKLEIFNCEVHGWGLAPNTIVASWFLNSLDFWNVK